MRRGEKKAVTAEVTVHGLSRMMFSLTERGGKEMAKLAVKGPEKYAAAPQSPSRAKLQPGERCPDSVSTPRTNGLSYSERAFSGLHLMSGEKRPQKKK